LWWTLQSDNSGFALNLVDPAIGFITEQTVTLDNSGNSLIWIQGPTNGSLDNQVVIFHAELVEDPNVNTQLRQVFSANDQAPQVYVDTTAFSAIVNIKTALGARPELWTVSIRNDDRYSYGTNLCDLDTTKEFRMYSTDGSTYSDGNYLNTDEVLIDYWTEISPNTDGQLPTRFVIPGLQPGCNYQITIGDYRGQHTVPAQIVSFQTKESNFIAFESIYPAVGPSTGGTTIKLRGAGFMDAAGQSRVRTVAIGAVEVPFTVLSETEISAITPAGEVGPVNVGITYTDLNAVAGPAAFHYIDQSIPDSCSNGKVAQWNFNDTRTVEVLGNSSCGNLDLQRSGNYGTLPVHGVGMNGSPGLQLSNAAFLGISPFNGDTATPTTIVPSSLLGLAHYSISAWFQKPASN
jgi:hypothetical protein